LDCWILGFGFLDCWILGFGFSDLDLGLVLFGFLDFSPALAAMVFLRIKAFYLLIL